MLRRALFGYILLIPFLHALSPVAVESLCFFVLVALSPFILPTNIAGRTGFVAHDLMVLAALAWGVAAWAFYPAPVEIDRVQGLLQWTASVLVSFLILRKLIILSDVRLEDIGRCASYALLILSLAIILDFYLANTRGEYLSDFIPFSVSDFPKAEVLGVFERPRGLTVEAGFNGIVYECLLPFATYYFLLRRTTLGLLAHLASAAGLILIFSSATIFAFAAAGTLLFLIKKRSLIGIVGAFFLLPALLYLVLSNSLLYDIFGYKIAEFLNISNYGVAGTGRQGSLFYAFELFRENIFGIGWGTILQEASVPGTVIDYMLDGNSLISLWLELLVASGIIGFGLFAFVFAKAILQLARDPAAASGFIMMSLTAVTFHHLFVYDMWFPMIWFSLAVAQIAQSPLLRVRFLTPRGVLPYSPVSEG